VAIADRITKFFVDASDLEIDGEDVPVTASDCRVTHLIDGSNYFGALRQEVDAFKAAGTGNRFFYFTSWWLSLIDIHDDVTSAGIPSAFDEPVGNEAFRLDDSSGGSFPLFIDELAAMAGAGVDVRAFPWVPPFVLTIKKVAEKEHRYSDAVGTVLSADAIRQKPGFEHKAVLNLLAHPIGSMHLKMVVCGDDTNARGYMAGMDFQPGRVDTQRHPLPHGWTNNYKDVWIGWHDIGAKVEGAAVDAIYGYFQRLWNEQITRPVEKFRLGDKTVASHDDQCEPVPDRTFLDIPGATHHVQVLRTAPQVHVAADSTPIFPEVGCVERIVAGFRRPSLSFAPDGIFEFRCALKKAIAAAEQYIYVEDQSFEGREIMDWIHDALVETPDLKAIFVYGFDPTDPPESRELLNMAVNEHLALPDVPDLEDRVAFHFRADDVVVHAKTWIIDDEFAIIGTANSNRRSLYTDGEISVGVLDENEGAGSFAVDYRCDLWAEHCGVYDAAGRAAFGDLEDALQIWHPAWSTGEEAPGSLLTTAFKRYKVPFTHGLDPDEFEGSVFIPAPGDNLERREMDLAYDRGDPDSRTTF
jgi:phosphatidylserine/phosphatidylglycerophosphate/cardiolipin synthase-like enzyme